MPLKAFKSTTNITYKRHRALTPIFLLQRTCHAIKRISAPIPCARRFTLKLIRLCLGLLVITQKKSSLLLITPTKSKFVGDNTNKEKAQMATPTKSKFRSTFTTNNLSITKQLKR